MLLIGQRYQTRKVATSAWQSDERLLDKSHGHCFWGAAFAEVTDEVLNFPWADRQIEVECHNWMPQERCPRLIYWAGLPSQAVWDEGTEMRPQSRKARRGMGEIKSKGCLCWGEIWKGRVKLWDWRGPKGLKKSEKERGGWKEKQGWRCIWGWKRTRLLEEVVRERERMRDREALR